VSENSKKILYLVADLRAVGPTRQTLNIIKYSGVIDSCVVLTMFDEPPQSLINLYLDAEIKVSCLHLNRFTFICNAVKKIADFCRTNQIDAIHSYGVKPDIVAHFAAKMARIKHIITLRNFPKEDLTGRMSRRIGAIVAQFHLFVLKRCKYLIACSKTIAKKMSEAYGVKITPIQNGVDTTLFANKSNDSKAAFCSEFGFSLRSKLFVCTNSFIPRKHNDEIAKAFIAMNSADAELIFLGDGPLLGTAKQQYSSFPKIHFMGKRTAVARFLQHSDLFVSASDSEGLPNSVLEALACGCFVLLSNIPQHQEILEEVPDCGEVFSLHDVDALANLMTSFASEHTLDMDTNDALQNSPFTMEKMGESYKKYYGNIKC